uniref:RWP-RK domain-containing protein n=1 Tax=Kalanchoe fedtschenkoi TaxID=63787 RepID=A0A7N0ZY07_KALFE
MDSYHTGRLNSDPLYASLNIIDHHFPDDFHGMDKFGNQQSWARDHRRVPTAPERSDRKSSRKMRDNCKSATESNNSVAEFLTWEIISKYFYMPIARAAEELNIGLTLFKKRCRELGVGRWPHRKLMSIKSLIKNEMEEGGVNNRAVEKATIRSAIQELESQRKMMEAMPEVELEAQTKRLRQACFKANYKKRRLMIMSNEALADSNGSVSSSKDRESTTSSMANVSFSSSSMPGRDVGALACGLEESDELQSLLFDALSPSEWSFLSDFI